MTTGDDTTKTLKSNDFFHIFSLPSIKNDGLDLTGRRHQNNSRPIIKKAYFSIVIIIERLNY